ncbi:MULTISPECIES: GGDEF domain-containing protein [Sphingobium]|uniref:GGDEF domain-containing protein n=1 Tax=Sphingobium TaxID=165695 RepID=UPI0015EC37C0|nr:MULTISPECIES: GGDEF domain-containing protein [Sphingobium]MCW2362969.1 diguanylate cyclase (GGDEF)-like protein [Sphingobium sp. B10D3B]MCW2400351.1 diguanylate cyclase (GGDEF)-like protein [Sphingobium sp. B10D7B]MCW2407329.1 diguanylate cyclase (GGDEF)-like protein [Sphingobium xanthum]
MDEGQVSSERIDAIERALLRPVGQIALEPSLETAYLDRTDLKRRTTIASWHIGALIANLACLPLDYIVGQLQLGLALRLGITTPVYLLAMVIVIRGPKRLQNAAIILPMVIFVATVTYLGLQVGQPHSDRYLMAAALLLIFKNLAIPTSVRQALATTTLSILSMFGLAFLLRGPNIESLTLCGFITLASFLPLVMRCQAERSARNAFLVELRDELKSAQLVALTQALAELAETDPLTGMRNRRSLSETLNGKWAAASADNAWFGILMIDIDRFKLFNDTAGHDAGDRCLERVALALQSEVHRQGHYIARFGGEEFTAITYGLAPEPALAFAETLRRAVLDLAIPHPGCEDVAPVTVSIGVAVLQPSAQDSVEDVIGAADGALYKAKANGRNCVVGSAGMSGYIARTLMKDAG